MNWFNLQNMNGSRRTRPSRHVFWHGRAWLGDRITVEWVHGKLNLACTLELGSGDSGDEALFHVAVPGLSYFLGLRLPELLGPLRLDACPRLTGVRVHHGCVWLSLWERSHEWRRDDPWWQRATIHVVDVLLGPVERTAAVIDEVETDIPLPGGKACRAKVKLEERTLKRRRWFGSTHRHASVDVPKPVGPSETYGMSMPARDIPDAIGQYVAGVIRDWSVKPAEGPDPVVSPARAELVDALSLSAQHYRLNPQVAETYQEVLEWIAQGVPSERMRELASRYRPS